MRSRNEKDDKKGFLKYYKWSKIVLRITKIWLVLFAFIAIFRLVVLHLLSKFVHFVRDAVTSDPNGYLKDLFPNADKWGNKFDNNFLFDMDNFLRNGIIITLILIGVYVLLIMLRHRNGEQAPILNELEAHKIKKMIIRRTGAVLRKTYKDENKKVRKYKKADIKTNRRIRKCNVEIHTYNKYNSSGMPPVKTYQVSFKRLKLNAHNNVMHNRIKNIHHDLNAEIDASFSELDNYQGLYISNVEKQLEKAKESIFVKLRKRRRNKEEGYVEESEFSFPLSLFEDRTETIESKRDSAYRYAGELQEAISLHLTTKNIFADKSEMFVINTSIEYRYKLPPNTKKLPNLEELQTTLNTTLDVEGANVKLKGKNIVIVVPLPKEYHIPIDMKSMLEKTY